MALKARLLDLFSWIGATEIRGIKGFVPAYKEIVEKGEITQNKYAPLTRIFRIVRQSRDVINKQKSMVTTVEVIVTSQFIDDSN